MSSCICDKESQNEQFWEHQIRRKLIRKILTIAVIIALTTISGIVFAEDLVQIPITKEALVGTCVGEWDRGYTKKGQRLSGEVEIIFNNTDSFDYPSSGPSKKSSRPTANTGPTTTKCTRTTMGIWCSKARIPITVQVRNQKWEQLL